MKYFLHAFGCRVNQCESDELRPRLAASGGCETRDLAEADICVIHTCTVTRDADREAFKFMRRVVRHNPLARMVVTGCLASRAAHEIGRMSPRALIAQKGRLPEVLNLPGNGPARIARDRARAMMKVQDGCDGFCSYCVVPLVRPRMSSLAPQAVEARIRALIAAGVPEIVLCGIRLGRYLFQGTDLVGLLKRLLFLPGTFRLRLSSLEIGEASDELAALIAGSGGKLCPHLHLPLQSGSDAVLRRMNRPYGAAAFARRLEALRRLRPGLAFFTDIIAGFPGESDAEFRESLDFVRGLGLRGLHVFRYSLREGTPAASMPGQVPPALSRERFGAWQELDRSLRRAHAREALGEERLAVPLKTKALAVTEDFLTVRLDRRAEPGLRRVRVIGVEGIHALGRVIAS